jgi:deoxyribose-phosphate aldolase
LLFTLVLTPVNIAPYIDHTLLKADVTADQVRRACAEARQFGFAAVCINLQWMALAAAELRDTPVRVCTVAGFPLGASGAAAKLHEAAEALKLGADEVDMVISIGALKDRRNDSVRLEITSLASLCHDAGAWLKVILETAVLSDEEKVRGCELAAGAGADFVKTSTGFGPAGATASDVALMRRTVGAALGVKAAGGIRSYEQALALLSAGANRLGTSASVEIMRNSERSAPASTWSRVTG